MSVASNHDSPSSEIREGTRHRKRKRKSGSSRPSTEKAKSRKKRGSSGSSKKRKTSSSHLPCVKQSKSSAKSRSSHGNPSPKRSHSHLKQKSRSSTRSSKTSPKKKSHSKKRPSSAEKRKRNLKNSRTNKRDRSSSSSDSACSSSSICSSSSSSFDSSGSSDDSSSSSSGESFNPRHAEIAFVSGLNTGERIPDKIKKLIYEGKYVDFTDLVCPEPDIAGPKDSSNLADSLRAALFSLPKKRKVLTQLEWLRAFDIFLVVHCQRFPKDFSSLVTYSTRIKILMEKEADWRTYDAQFRKDRAISKCSWTVIREDLKSDALLSRFSLPKPSPRSSSHLLKPGFCYRYNTPGGRCEKESSCTYSHTCTKCRGKHPVYQCYQLKTSHKPFRYRQENSSSQKAAYSRHPGDFSPSAKRIPGQAIPH